MKLNKWILGIILCILLVGIGCFMYINSDKKELDNPIQTPENKPVEVDKNDSESSFDESEDNEKKPIISDNTPEKDKPTKPNTFDDTNITTNPSDNDNSSIEKPEDPSISNPDSIVDSKPEIPDSKPEIPEESFTQQEKANDIKRKQIQNTYGLTIAYGNESMTVPGRELIRMTDAETIQKNLNILEKQLEKYPNGFFKSFERGGMPLTILLVEGIVGRDIAGAADTQDATSPKLILTNRNFEEVIHHEMMHCIDLYLNIMMYRDGLDPFTEYEQYNPDDFEYGNIQYVEKEAGNPHFWFDYAKTNVSDDRAELFKAMMTINSVLLKRGALKDKGSVICRQIKKYFNLTEQTYWEKSVGISL